MNTTKKRKLDAIVAMEKIKLNLTCVITSDIFRIPVNLPCGHVVEFGDFKKWFRKKKRCPNCRELLNYVDVELLPINISIYNIISDIYPDVHTESVFAEKPAYPANNNILPRILQVNSSLREKVVDAKHINIADMIVLIEEKKQEHNKYKNNKRNEIKQWFSDKAVPSIYKAIKSYNGHWPTDPDFIIPVHMNKLTIINQMDKKILTEVLTEINVMYKATMKLEWCTKIINSEKKIIFILNLDGLEHHHKDVHPYHNTNNNRDDNGYVMNDDSDGVSGMESN
jgi:hypothetical protein